jgi:hypothetical protein
MARICVEHKFAIRTGRHRFGALKAPWQHGSWLQKAVVETKVQVRQQKASTFPARTILAYQSAVSRDLFALP